MIKRCDEVYLVAICFNLVSTISCNNLEDSVKIHEVYSDIFLKIEHISNLLYNLIRNIN